MTLMIGDTLGLYIHIPWCIKKCPYCDFNSHQLPSAPPFADYVTALLDDVKAQACFVRGRQIDSIFIGGGTPSLLPICEYRRLFDGLRTMLDIAKDCEITLEANPATLEHAPFEEYLSLGINRLSLGVQSFCDEMLQSLGRIHTSHHAKSAITSAKKAGFLRINTDIMHGLPNQSVQGAMSDLSLAIELGASHVSWYQLTIEPNTVFYRTRPMLPHEETLEQIEMGGRALLMEAGFDNYEISAWVKLAQDVPCRHNVNYWRFGDYLAIGAGAHGKITVNDEAACVAAYDVTHDIKMEGAGIYRFYKSRLPKDYLTYEHYPKFVDWRKIPTQELPFEYMMNVLRLRQGVCEADFKRRTGLDFELIAPVVKKLRTERLMSADRLCATDYGYRYLNQLVQSFL